MNTSRKGAVSESRIVAALVASGCTVSVPVGNYAPYDLVVDDGTTLRKVQCKTGRWRHGCVLFKTHSETRGRLGRKKVPYGNRVDAYAVYCPPLDQIFVVPATDVTTKVECSLRVSPMKVKTAPKALYAARYKLGM